MKKNLRRMLVVGIILAMIFSLSACSKSEDKKKNLKRTHRLVKKIKHLQPLLV